MSQIKTNDLAPVITALHNGELIAYPTEAVFGLGCDPSNEAALKKLIALKQRDPNKGLILIASRIEQLYPFISESAFDLRPEIKTQWPGPITWVMPCKENISELITGNRNTLAVRVSAHPVVKSLCDSFEKAIISTSANVSGEEPFMEAKALKNYFGDNITVIDKPLGKAKHVTSIFDAQTGRQLR